MKQSVFRKYVSDKVKEASSTGEAWLTWGEERLKIVPLSQEDCADPPGGDYIVKHRGEVYADVFGRRKGTGPLTAMSHSFIVPPKNIMAAVAERHNRSEARTQVVALLHKGWWREDYSTQEFSHIQQALQQILNQRVPGWWRLRHIFLKFRVCSNTEFSRIKETSWKNKTH